ncbi:MAG: response regulator [Cytophagia bacterium]|nr:response regulator [Cytophagia bacterium]
MTWQNKRVLIVENEVIVADDISRIVEELGCSPLNPAFSFAQAIDSFKSNLPDLIILDIRLNSKKTGIEFAEWLRESHKTPIIYLTVFDDEPTSARGKRTKPHAYLVKPFVDEELKNAISQALIQ